MKLTPAQKREYELLKKHGSVYVVGWQRHNVLWRLVDFGLATSDSWHWFHLKDKNEQNKNSKEI